MILTRKELLLKLPCSEIFIDNDNSTFKAFTGEKFLILGYDTPTGFVFPPMAGLLPSEKYMIANPQFDFSIFQDDDFRNPNETFEFVAPRIASVDMSIPIMTILDYINDGVKHCLVVAVHFPMPVVEGTIYARMDGFVHAPALPSNPVNYLDGTNIFEYPLTVDYPDGTVFTLWYSPADVSSVPFIYNIASPPFIYIAPITDFVSFIGVLYPVWGPPRFDYMLNKKDAVGHMPVRFVYRTDTQPDLDQFGVIDANTAINVKNTFIHGFDNPQAIACNNFLYIDFFNVATGVFIKRVYTFV